MEIERTIGKKVAGLKEIRKTIKESENDIEFFESIKRERAIQI